MLKAVIILLIVATARGASLLDHCREKFPDSPTDYDYFRFAKCCVRTPGYDADARTECATWLASSADKGAYIPTLDQIKSRYSIVASRHALVNGAVKELQRDSLGETYVGSTNIIDGDIDFGMGEVAPVKEWNPRDILECYILRPIDKGSYAEHKLTIRPGSQTDTSEPIQLHVTYSGASMSLPLVPELSSEFTFGSNVDVLSVTNTDHYDILVNAKVLIPFDVLPGDAANRENYCDTQAVLGK